MILTGLAVFIIPILFLGIDRKPQDRFLT